MKSLACLLALFASFANSHAADKVRVDASSGAPRIMVDGKPVRARIFFGNPGAATIKIGHDAQELSYDFTCLGDSGGTGTMQWRFGQTPGEVFLDDIHLVDLDDGKDVCSVSTFDHTGDFEKDWNDWPPGAQNTVGQVRVEPGSGRDGSGALHVTLTAPSSGPWPDFHIFHEGNLNLIRGHHYRISFWARAVPERDISVAFYKPGATYVYLGGPDAFETQVRMAAAGGVNFVSFSCDPLWLEPGKTPDWGGVDAVCQRILDINPNALLIPRMSMYPPKWWCDAHPDDVMVWDKPGNPTMYDVASPVYRQEAVRQVTQLVAHLEEKFGPHMAGYHPVGQNTGEWFYMGTWDPPLNGYAKADLAAFRAWLKSKYPTDDDLQAAWHDAKATLDSATVPSPDQRRSAPGGVFRDPATEQAIIDFTDFQQDSMASCLYDIAHAVRQASQGRKLVLFFYGYLYEFGFAQNGPGISGHYALRKILDCPDIDIICSPISYGDRASGGGAPCMSAAESIALADKMYLREDDTRTYLASDMLINDGSDLKTLDETLQVLARNVAVCATRNLATWWMDLPAQGWFRDARFWSLMAQLKALDQPFLDHPTPYTPEVASVIDEETMCHVAYNGSAVTAPLVSDGRVAFGRMGAPYGQYLMDDVLAGKVHAKLYVFLDAWRLTPDQRDKLLAATEGSARIWCYAPGYFENDQPSEDAMRSLTGFRLKAVTGVNASVTPTDVGKDAGVQPITDNTPITPLFAVDDADTHESLATYSDGSTAVALRHGATGLSAFVGTPHLTPELLRYIADQAGVHLYTRTNCNVYANGPILALHASQDGPIDIDTGQTDPVTDLMTGQSLGNGPTLTLTMKKGETRILKIGVR